MCTLKTKGSRKEPVLRQMRKTTKRPLFRSDQKYVETYSSSNVAAQYPEERVNQPGYTAYHEEKSMNVVIFFTGI